MTQQQIKGATGGLGSDGSLDVYDVPGSVIVTPYSVSASFDGSGAAGTFLPCLTFKTQTGAVIARCPAPEVAAGDTAEVSWFPHVGGGGSDVPPNPGQGCVYYVGQPTGNAAIDTAAIQAAHDSLPAEGGIVQLCRGTYAIANAGLAFSKPIQLVGHGRVAPPDGSEAAGPAPTQLDYGSTTGTAIAVTSSTTFVLRDFDLVNTSTPTAGAGISVTGSGGSYPRGFQFIGLSVRGFFRCIDIIDGQGWLMQRCYIGDWTGDGVRIQNTILSDAGDMGFEACYFAWGPNNQVAATHGIEWNSSGGLRIVNCKFNWFSGGVSIPANTIAVQIAPTAGITTSDILICNCSIENFAFGIVLSAGHLNGSVIRQFCIVGNEIVASSGVIAVVPSDTGVFSALSILGNTINGDLTGVGLTLQNVDNIKYGPNVYAGCTTNISVGGGVTNATAVGGG